MKQLFSTIFLIFFSSAIFGQINVQDSTAQVISYWSIGDKQSYSISLQKIKLNGVDTASNEMMTYDVEVTVIDSTANSYLIEWLYHNYKTNSTNPLIQKLSSLSENIKVLIETDELGMIKGVKNWEEVRDYIKKSITLIKSEFKEIPQLDQILKQIEVMYTSKQAIESASIQDVQQFHTFHGGKYFLGEVIESTIQVPNMHNPQKPLDSYVTLYLDEINPEDSNFIIRSSTEIDSEQLTNTTLEYLKTMAEQMGTKPPEKEDLGLLTNVINTASRIHDSGWIIYSIQTKTVQASGASGIEERIIEIK